MNVLTKLTRIGKKKYHFDSVELFSKILNIKIHLMNIL